MANPALVFATRRKLVIRTVTVKDVCQPKVNPWPAVNVEDHGAIACRDTACGPALEIRTARNKRPNATREHKSSSPVIAHEDQALYMAFP